MALIICFLLVYVTFLGTRPLVIPDETRYLEIPREMLSTGDWVVPRLAGVRYFEKPVLGYWVHAVSMSLFGQNRFAGRLPSAAAAGLSALLVFVLLRKFTSNPRTALLGAGILLTCIEFFALGVFIVLDGLFSLFVTGTMVFYYLACMEKERGRKIGFLIMCGLFCGLGFLTKGFLALALPAVTIVPFLIWEKRGKDILTSPWIPALTALAVSLPWCIRIAVREPDFWRYFIWVEHLGRFASAGGAQHPEPFWFFIPILIGGAMPWTVLLPAAICGAGKSALKESLIRFAICWFVFPLLLFSASEGKLGTYILPCFPALAVIMAVGLERYIEAGHRKLFSIAALLTAAVIAILALVLVALQLFDFGFKLYEPDETEQWILAAIALAAWSGLVALSVRTAEPWKRIVLFMAAPMLFLVSSHFAFSREMENEKAPEPFLKKHCASVSRDSVIVSDDYVGPAVCWFFKRSDILLIGASGELTYGLKQPDAGNRILSARQFKKQIASIGPGKDLVLIVDQDRYKDLKRFLPTPTVRVMDAGFVFARFRQ